jgi:chromosomal replication initiation ATPase DnaA
VLSSDRPPDAVATLEDRLRSRFKMGLVTDIQPPDFETRLAILRKKAEQGNTPIPNSVLEFIVTHVTNNIRELEGALNRVTAYASLNQTELTIEDAERVLGDIVKSGKRAGHADTDPRDDGRPSSRVHASRSSRRRTGDVRSSWPGRSPCTCSGS